MERRHFLGIGIATGFSLILGRCVYDQHQAFPDVTIAQKEAVLAACVPIFLDGALKGNAAQKQKAIQRTVQGCIAFINDLPKGTQLELDQLFEQLSGQLIIFATLGQWQYLTHLPLSYRAKWVEALRHHGITLLRQAYEGLREMIIAAYYAHPEHWSALQYQKPQLGIQE